MADTPNNNNNDQLRARLALTSQGEIADWQKKEEYLQKRKLEAAKAMASDEQKKNQEEVERARLNKLEAQKKLADLEATRRAEEEIKNKDISTKQREADLAQEKLRQERIRQILEAQKETERIKQSTQSSLSSIHTLTKDLSQEIREGGITASSLARTVKPEAGEEQKTFSWRKILILTFTFLLIVGGVTAIVWSLAQRVPQSQAPAQLIHNSIIFADEHVAVDLQGQSAEQIKQTLNNFYTQSVIGGIAREKIKDIYFISDNKFADPTLFATSTNLIITDDLLRFLNPDFMLGIYVGQETVPFYIFSTNSYKNSADALLRNENEITSQLLSPFLNSETIALIKQTPFQDKMIQNRNVRIVANQDNVTQAVYAWLDKNTIAITTSDFALSKIINSFLTSKPVVR